jgi:hypothetical protein
MTTKLCAHGKQGCPYCLGPRPRRPHVCASCFRTIPSGQGVCGQCVERGFDPQALPLEEGDA